MLDDQTKARINSARDILVGKVPDPKSQVEQITIALIYKFMDDMDRQSEELGGKASFFSDGFKKYAWHKLIDPRLSGHERLMIYAEGLEKMNENKHIPQLFRDIFKGVFLPYRDPETLNLFLKQINEFSYDHSEQLGDAFEYLLSVLGSQGDAGQFRTPRHIIDFIVRIVEPKKNETVLDPACGTAGFLISAYKHILAANSKEGKGDLLTGDERGRLMDNFCGYDISPDMVRLSRANMYLHGFPQPRIHEYDTLTSEERWDERYDVIMANPPFMTPKGGIRPHNRFSIKATRSEVLFVDYIAEHLNVNGRAGVIVPEGIIFQGGNAYRTLRRMLVENYLWCVVSLPAGVFNPYSGVKTCILLMDKALAKRTDEVFFVKIENDGFGLGAQRRAVESNDLPGALKAIQEWRGNRQNAKSSLAHAVSRKRILESPDCNLSSERYKDKRGRVSRTWPMVVLAEICENTKDSIDPQKENGEVFYVGLENIEGGTGRVVGTMLSDYRSIKSQKLRFSPRDVLYGKLRPNLNKVWLADRTGICSTDIMVLRFDESRALSGFLGYVMREPCFNLKVVQGIGGAQLPRVNFAHFASIQVPLPSLDVQKQIVVELDRYRKIIEGAKQVIANYKPRITIHADWPDVTFSDAPLQIIDGDRGTNYPKKEDFTGTGYCLFLNTKNVRENGFLFEEVSFISKEKDEALSQGKLKPRDVVLTTRGTVGNTGVFDNNVPFEHIRINSGMLIFRPDEAQLDSEYLFMFFQSENFKNQVRIILSGSAQPQLPIRNLQTLHIPIPDIGTQKAIVSELESERALVEANQKLIEIYDKKIRDKLAEIWGEEEK